jgi:hypothetical protein
MVSKRKSNAVAREQSSSKEKPENKLAPRTLPQEIVPAEETRVFVDEVFDSITRRLHDQIWATSGTFRRTLDGQSHAEDEIAKPKRQPKKKRERKTQKTRARKKRAKRK